MELSQAIKNRIINLAKANNITLHKLSLKSGIPYSTLSSFMNGKCKSQNISTLLHLCEGFGIDLKTFFSDEMFNDVEQD